MKDNAAKDNAATNNVMKAEWRDQLPDALRCLHDGECVGMPTETVYGLAADALNPQAVAKVFATKRRPAFDPLIIHVSPDMDIERFVTLNETARLLIDQLWPGPLTLLIKKRPVISDLVTSGHETVAIRCPAHPVAQSLIRSFGGPLVAPSANLFGHLSPTTADAVRQGLGESLFVLEGGCCDIGLESTIVNTTAVPPSLPVLRLGGTSIEKLTSLGFELSYPTPIIGQAPGTLKNHYAPRIPLYLWTADRRLVLEDSRLLPENSDDPLSQERLDRLAWLGWSNHRKEFGASYVLSERGNPQEAAYHVFSHLRLIGDLGFEGIIAELPPSEGLGIAIQDRLRRGASGFAKGIVPMTGGSIKWYLPVTHEWSEIS